MKKLVLDIECTYTKVNKRTNPSPYLTGNKLVSVGYILFDDTGILDTDYLIFNHITALPECQAISFKTLQKALDQADLIIGHNLKFDMSWLYECGLTYDKALYDTMICEYVFAKGLKTPLSLEVSCQRYGLDAKSDVLGIYRDRDINTDAVPLDELVEYGKQDIIITKQLYHKQQDRIAKEPDCAYMAKAVDLMNETLPILIEMERTGICIDLAELAVVEKQYREEYNLLQNELSQIVVDVMGHTPINLESPEHLSWVLYSRKVKDKKAWAETFNLGSELRNSVRKTKYSVRMSRNEFRIASKDNTEKLYKTEAHQCHDCVGKGFIQKVKKNGEQFKKTTVCKTCEGKGFVYTPIKAYAGFKLEPLGANYASIGGFSTDKITILELLKVEGLSEQCKKFLTGLLRMNAISTYLGTFVEGIKNNVQGCILHTSFNQCITSTGRLSSSNPNFQNLPRSSTFPVRKVITSRFKDGKILSVDFKQLEFRVAAILANDKQAQIDIENGIDVHQMTGEIIFNKKKIDCSNDEWREIRQAAKPHTFKPLYGGTRGTPGEEAYYKAFLVKYKGIDTWQKGLENTALYDKQIKSPSGRIYAFPHVKRMPNGSVLGQTQIKNYIVQGFATGDINPVAMIELNKLMKGLKSKIILSVHDDITIDVHPDEIDLMVAHVKTVFNNMNEHIRAWFGIDTPIAIEGDISMGDNWLNKMEIAA